MGSLATQVRPPPRPLTQLYSSLDALPHTFGHWIPPVPPIAIEGKASQLSAHAFDTPTDPLVEVLVPLPPRLRELSGELIPRGPSTRIRATRQGVSHPRSLRPSSASSRARPPRSLRATAEGGTIGISRFDLSFGGNRAENALCDVATVRRPVLSRFVCV